jgi:hypothetical protein
LAGGEVNIFVMVEVLTEALGRDVIMPGRNIAIDGAAVCDSPEKVAVHVDIREVEALERFVWAVEPDPGLTRRSWRCRDWDRRRRLDTGRPRSEQQAACPLQPSSGNAVFGHDKHSTPAIEIYSAEREPACVRDRDRAPPEPPVSFGSGSAAYRRDGSYYRRNFQSQSRSWARALSMQPTSHPLGKASPIAARPPDPQPIVFLRQALLS